MKIKLFCMALFAVFCLSLRTIAQEDYDGTRKYLQTNVIDAISYTSTTFSKQNIFYNRFSIFLKSKSSKADTIYVVDVNFDRSNNLIDILQLDKQANQYLSKTIEFHPLSNQLKQSTSKPTYCVKNYIFNDTLLSVTKDNNADILFTIDDTINPVILLHQIVSIDGKKKFDLDKFRKTFLTPHLSHARDYWEWQKEHAITIDPPVDPKRILQKEIEKEKILINEDKEAIKSALSNKLKTINLSDTTNASLPQAFVRKMDDVFTEYFNKPISYNARVTGNYKIYVNTDGSKKIVETFTPEKFPNCFLAQFIAIHDVIDNFPLANEGVSVCNDNPMNTIHRNHSVRFDSFKTEAASLNYSLDTAFKPIFNTADFELKKICDEKTKLTTIYNYPYQVVSKVEWQKWKVKGNRITEHDTLIQNQDIIHMFYGDSIKRKWGRYDVSLNTTKFNERTFGPMLGSVKRDYKFRTYICFNYGAFIGNKDTLNNGVADQRLWNIFIIHHHFGIFGGSTYNQNSSAANQFENYREGGIYLAPGKGLYLKLGLANYKDSKAGDITKLILGCSLIFPVFHVEGGYNFALKLPYVMAGFNIPFNR